MKNIKEYISEKKTTSSREYFSDHRSEFTINGIKVHYNELIWVKDPEDEDSDCVAMFLRMNDSSSFDAAIGDKEYEFDSEELIETVEMANAREAAEKAKANEKTAKYKEQLADLQKELEEVQSEMEADPEAIAAAQRGDEAVEYSKKMSKIMDKMNKLREKIQNIEHPNQHIEWVNVKGYLAQNPKEGVDYNWVEND